MTSTTFTIPAPDGHQTFVRLWAPAERPRGVIVICHGLAEHGGRYDRFAAALVAAGFAALAHDHRGHGHSSPEAEHGFFAANNGWQRVLDDLSRVVEAARQRFPGAPVLLFGHSMGSGVVTTWLQGRSDEVAAAMLSAPAGKVGPLLHAGKLAAQVEKRRLGARGRSKLLNQMAFGAYNAAFKPSRTDFDWLSKDPTEVDKYVADPWCGFIPSAQLWIDLLGAQQAAQDPAALARIRRDLPILVIAGGRDPVGGSGGKQVRQWLEMARRVGLAIEDRFWPEARHELLNEVEREDVTATVIAWIERHVPGLAAKAE
ncbi:MAG: alpha/beta hydrolase [Nannocystis sp.]|nr:alpha/beta hydrolase [Nannocystis sp.]